MGGNGEEKGEAAQAATFASHGLRGLDRHQLASLLVIRERCDEEGQCWLWTKSVNSSGYPQGRVDGHLRMIRTYVVTELLGQDVPPGWWITSECLNKRCCSPMCLTPMPIGKVLRRAYASGSNNAAVNYLRRVRGYEKGGRTRLGFEKARFLREEGADLSTQEAARMFEVSESAILRARNETSWRKLVPGASVFSPAGRNSPAVTRGKRSRTKTRPGKRSTQQLPLRARGSNEKISVSEVK